MDEENRLKIWDDYISEGGMQHRLVRHMLVDYNRYFEAKLIYDYFIEIGVKIHKLNVLDYGCGVGDYGIYFLRRGCKKVTFWDFPRATKLIDYRMRLEGLKGKALSADDNPHPDFSEFNFVIFGEVLEHLHNPLEILTDCFNNKVPFIFTSSYPFRSDDAEDDYWNNPDHDQKALQQQPDCRRLLINNYNNHIFSGGLTIWSLK